MNNEITTADICPMTGTNYTAGQVAFAAAEAEAAKKAAARAGELREGMTEVIFDAPEAPAGLAKAVADLDEARANYCASTDESRRQGARYELDYGNGISPAHRLYEARQLVETPLQEVWTAATGRLAKLLAATWPELKKESTPSRVVALYGSAVKGLPLSRGEYSPQLGKQVSVPLAHHPITGAALNPWERSEALDLPVPAA